MGEWVGILWASSAIAVPVAWLVLGLTTYVVDRRNKGRHAERGAGQAAPRATRFGRLAGRTALVMAALLVIPPGISILPLVLRDFAPATIVAEYVWLAVTGAWVVLAPALGVLMIAAIVDMLRGGSIAGRDLKVAYALVAGLWAAQLSLLVAVAL